MVRDNINHSNYDINENKDYDSYYANYTQFF